VTCLDSPVLYVEIPVLHVEEKVPPEQGMMACFDFQVSQEETPVQQLNPNVSGVNSQFHFFYKTQSAFQFFSQYIVYLMGVEKSIVLHFYAS
jgi:hypothetical protein